MVDFVINFVSNIDPNMIAQGGGFVAILLRIIASKKLRKMVVDAFIRFFLGFIGRSKYEHHLFSEKEATLFLINNIQLADKLKTDLFRLILNTRSNIMIEYSQYWANKYNKKISKLGRIDMQKRMKRLYYYMRDGKNGTQFEGYEKAIKLKMMDVYGDEKGLKYYNYVYLEHFKPYSAIHDASIDNFFMNLFYYEHSGNEALVRYFLNRILSSIENSIDNLKFTFDDINGQLAKI